VAIYFSGAGGALFTVPIMFVPYILYSASSMPVKGIGIAMLLMLGGAFFFESQLFGRFLDIKLNLSYSENSTSGLDRLERSRDMRWTLVKYGWQKAIERPVGTGLGHTYADELSRLYYVAHVHNGTVTTLVELGFPGFATVACLLFWVMWGILRSPTIENQLKGFYFTYSFTIFGRSLSENYTPFDLGNFFNFVFLLFTISLFLHQRTGRFALITEGGTAPGRPVPMPRMGLRPPLPRPLPMR
jgi:O-antigen ligase